MSKVASLAAVALCVAACGAPAPAEPTAQPPTPSPTTLAPTARADATSVRTSVPTASGLTANSVSGTLVFIGDAGSPIAFDGATCKGVGNYAAIHDGANLTFYDAADTQATPTAIGVAQITGGQPAGQDCSFTFGGYVLPAGNYLADVQIYAWQLPGPLQSPLHLRFKASSVRASASP